MKPLLVGELNPYGRDPRYALYPLPVHASGARLCAILGLTARQYLRLFDRANLCEGRWSAVHAYDRAMYLLRTRRVIVALGLKVGRSFIKTAELFGDYALTHLPARVVVIPHPSGLNRVYNDRLAVMRARDLVAQACGLTLEAP